MAKKKKKHGPKKPQDRWHLPQPGERGPVKAPDIAAHLNELMTDYVQRHNPVSSRIPKQFEYYIEFNRRANEAYAKLNKAFDDYYQQLVSTGQFHTNADIEKMDTIDLRTSRDLSEDTRQGIERFLQNTFPILYAAIPCFEKGCLAVNDRRRILFEVKSIDTETGSVTTWIQDCTKQNEGQRWDIGISGEVTMSFCGAEKTRIETEYSAQNVTDFVNLYTLIPPSRLRWDKETMRLWTEVVLQNAVDQKKRFADANADPMVQLARIFYSNIIVSNYYLSQFRPKILVPEKTAKETKPGENESAKQDRPAPENIPEKRVRVVGSIQFVSEKPPHAASHKTIRQYKTAVWTTRGHTRRYKSGKIAYIKPSVHHRKALQEKEQTPAQSIIQIKNFEKYIKSNEKETVPGPQT